MKKMILLTFLFPILSLAAVSNDVIFEKKKLTLGAQVLTVEVADTPERSARGLMFRKALKEDEGMLFIFNEERALNFWMKNTFIPLSIGFFNKKKQLIDIQDMTPVTSEMQMDIPSYTSKGPATYALEVPIGWFRKHKISLKTQFELK